MIVRASHIMTTVNELQIDTTALEQTHWAHRKFPPVSQGPVLWEI